MASELVLIKYPHEHVGDIPDYHEWVEAERVKADARGRLNPRVMFAMWRKWICWTRGSNTAYSRSRKWICNNPDCTAMALVSDQAIERLIENAEADQ